MAGLIFLLTAALFVSFLASTLVYFVVSLFRFVIGKVRLRNQVGAAAYWQRRERFVNLLVSTILAVLIWALFLGFILIFVNSISFM